jgi:hypothetical protein
MKLDATGLKGNFSLQQNPHSLLIDLNGFCHLMLNFNNPMSGISVLSFATFRFT